VDCKCNEIVLSHDRRKMICAVLDVWLIVALTRCCKLIPKFFLYLIQIYRIEISYECYRWHWTDSVFFRTLSCFYRIFCPPLETTFLHRSTPFLCQTTCFGGNWFPRGLIVRVKIFPLINPQTQFFGPFSNL